jgi:hypothetical protein
MESKPLDFSITEDLRPVQVCFTSVYLSNRSLSYLQAFKAGSAFHPYCLPVAFIVLLGS